MAIQNISLKASGSWDATELAWSTINAAANDFLVLAAKSSGSGDSSSDVMNISGESVVAGPTPPDRQVERITEYPAYSRLVLLDTKTALQQYDAGTHSTYNGPQAGDMVSLKGGVDYDTGWDLNWTGTAAQPIVITTRLNDTNRASFSGFGTGDTSTANGYGIRLSGASYVTLLDLEIGNVYGPCVAVGPIDGSDSSPGSTGCVVQQCVLWEPGTHGIRVDGNSSDIEIADNEIRNTGMRLVDGADSVGDLGHGIMVGSDQEDDASDNIWVHHNWIHDVTSGPAIEVYQHATSVTIEDNYCETIRVHKFGAITTWIGNNADSQDPNLIIRRNFIHDVARDQTYLGATSEQGAGIITGSRGTQIDHNIVWNTGWTGVGLVALVYNNSTGNVVVAFNTVMEAGQETQYADQTCFDFGATPDTLTGNVADDGTQGTGGTYATKADLQGATAVTVFAEGTKLRPLPTSTMDDGVTSSSVQKDIWGQPRPSAATSHGAIEYTGADVELRPTYPMSQAPEYPGPVSDIMTINTGTVRTVGSGGTYSSTRRR